MYVTIETQTERFFLEANSCVYSPIVPRQVGEPESVKTRTLEVGCVNGEFVNYDLEPWDTIYIMNDTGKTINRITV